MERHGTTSQRPSDVTRVDMHCHSTASQESKLGVQRAVGLPECATPPQEVYDRVCGRLCAADPRSLAEAVLELAASPALRRSIARAGLAAVREHTRECALERLGDRYARALAGNGAVEVPRAA